MPAPWLTRALPAAATVTPMGTVTLAGQSHSNRGIPRSHMRILGSYALVYVTAGGGDFGDARGRRWRVGAGDVFFLFPELAHFYEPGPDGRWDDIWLVFNGRAFDQWRREGLLDPADAVWRVEPVEFWRQRIAGALTGGSGAAAALVETARLLTLLAEMRVERAGGYDANAREPWLEEACQRLAAGSETPDWARLAREFGFTYEQFRKKFSAALGLPPARYRLAQRLDRAAVRLRADNAPLKEIADELGFCDEFHFSKLFKRRTGLSPRAYRAQWRGTAAGNR